jgi:hypothetical protein
LGRYRRGNEAGDRGLNDPADPYTNGRFKRENREVLEQMRQADRDARLTIEHRLGDRELRERRNE